MSDYREHVRVALEAITVHSQTSYSWFGQLSSRLPAKVRRMLSPQDARSYLLYDLSSRLYNCFYVKGAAITSKIDDDPLLPTGLTPFVAALSTANSGSGCLEDGWSVRAIENGSVTLMHGDLVVWVRPHECLLTEGGSIAPGMTVHLRLPKELLGMSPGFYMVLGDKALRPDSEQTLIRVYWNIRGESAVSFVGIASKLLNQAGFSFRLKILRDPVLFSRCDAAVVYFLKNDYQALAPIFNRLYDEVVKHLKPSIPVFTKPLAFGVGLAEDLSYNRKLWMTG